MGGAEEEAVYIQAGRLSVLTRRRRSLQRGGPGPRYRCIPTGGSPFS